MNKNEDIFKVSTSKAFRVMLFLGGVIVILLALTLIFVVPMQPTLAFNRIFLLCMSAFMILAFVWLFNDVSKLYSNPGQGIIINDEGIKIDIGEYKHFVRWTEITDLQINSAHRRANEILIFTEKTENPLHSNRFRQFLLNIGSVEPKNSISICAKWVNCRFEDLIDAIAERFHKHKSLQPKEIRKKANPKQRAATQEEIDKGKKKIYTRILMMIGVFVLFYLIAYLMWL